MELTELEHTANEEARHGNREALEARIAELEADNATLVAAAEGHAVDAMRAQDRIAELEGPDALLKLEREFDEARRIAWNAALEAAVEAVQDHIWDGIDDRLDPVGRGNNNAAKAIASGIRALRKGGKDG